MGKEEKVGIRMEPKKKERKKSLKGHSEKGKWHRYHSAYGYKDG